uniref:Uncharacterized protein n=1 Tax=Arundo donax TaxID=35708 RepID=A0A0A9BF17_ARUDO
MAACSSSSTTGRSYSYCLHRSSLSLHGNLFLLISP